MSPRRGHRLLGNFNQPAAFQHCSILGSEKIGLLFGEKVIIVFPNQFRIAAAKQFLPRFIEQDKPQIAGILDENGDRLVLNHRIEKVLDVAHLLLAAALRRV